MKFQLENVVRDNLKDLKPYQSLRDSKKIQSPMFLDANENPYGDYNRYPDSQHTLLKKRIAEIKKIESQHLFLGNGSDELIDLIIKAFCEPNTDEILVMNPSFVMYSFYAKINGNQINTLDLDEKFQINKEVFLNKIENKNLKILFLCSPNNPTGNDLDDLEFFVENFSGIVVIDEAYIEFSTRKSSVEILKKYPNLIILQTLSKAYGMAGLRIGIGIASVEIASLIHTIKSPYNLNILSQNAALNELSDQSKHDFYIQKIKSEREILRSELLKFPFVKKIFPTQANFFLIEFQNAKLIYDYLLSKNILTSLRHPQIENALRINIGTEKENKKLIEILQNFTKFNS